MKIIIFGATGTIGTHLVTQALAQGYKVAAFSRHPEKLEAFDHKDLALIKGDVLNQGEVTNAIRHTDAVCIALGSGKSRKGTVRSEGTKRIINGMKEHGVKRLLCQTTLGAGESRGNLNFFWKHVMFGWLLKQVYKDHELQESYVRGSGLEWTIIRPGAFTEGAKTERYRHGFPTNDRTVSLKISRADIADFMVKQLKSATYLYRAPGLSY